MRSQAVKIKRALRNLILTPLQQLHRKNVHRKEFCPARTAAGSHHRCGSAQKDETRCWDCNTFIERVNLLLRGKLRALLLLLTSRSAAEREDPSILRLPPGIFTDRNEGERSYHSSLSFIIFR